MHDDENCKFYGENGIVDLTIKENLILKELLKNKGEIVTYEDLCMLLYNDNVDDYYKYSIRCTLFRLRNKLKDVFIQNVRGKGYVIE